MGIRNVLRLVEAAESYTAPTSQTRAIRSPWAVGQLSQIVFSDIFGVENVPVSRPEAMALPAVARGRHLLCTSIASMPLKAFKGAEELATQPTWLYRTNGRTSPQLRMAWTVDDLLFGGWSLWAVERDGQGRISDAARCPAEMWEFDPDGNVLVADKPVEEESVILIPGFHEGLLAFGARTIRSARALEEIVAQRSANPIPAVELHQTSDDELDDDEIASMVTDYCDALSSPGGAVVYSPSTIELKVHGSEAAELVVEGRNASAIDIARLMGIPAAMIDASNVNSTLTYETLQGRAQEFIAFSVSLYTTAIEARLSMDDVTPRGTRIGFDTSNLTVEQSPTGPATED